MRQRISGNGFRQRKKLKQTEYLDDGLQTLVETVAQQRLGRQGKRLALCKNSRLSKSRKKPRFWWWSRLFLGFDKLPEISILPTWKLSGRKRIINSVCRFQSAPDQPPQMNQSSDEDGKTKWWHARRIHQKAKWSIRNHLLRKEVKTREWISKTEIRTTKLKKIHRFWKEQKVDANAWYEKENRKAKRQCGSVTIWKRSAKAEKSVVYGTPYRRSETTALIPSRWDPG